MQTDFDYWRLLAGIALFLFAMMQLETALKTLGGRSLTLYLRQQTGKRINAVIGGIVATALLQSSSVVGLMVLAFTGAGLLSLPAALGIVFGSNLGTTLTGWIVATLGFKFEIFELALPLITLGGGALLFGKGRWIEIGRAVLGMGLLLLALQFMQESVAGLEHLVNLQDLAGLAPWQYLLFGLIVAGVIQSSSATMMLTLTALHAGIITLPNAAAIVIGADLGTTTTVMLGALKGSAEKKRVALGQVIFNAVTDAIAFTLRLPLLGLIALLGIEDPLYSLVAFHSLFNLLGLVIFLPLTTPFAAFLERLIGDADTREAHYLADVSPAVSEAALTAIEHETSLLIARAIRLTLTAFDPPLIAPPGRLPIARKIGDREQRARSFDDLYRASKTLEGEILEFAIQLQAGTLTEENSVRLEQLLAAGRRSMRSAKAIKDIRHNLFQFAGSTSDSARLFLKRFRNSMLTYVVDLYGLREEGTERIAFEDLATVLQRLHERHDEIHQSIFNDVRDGRVTEALVSTLLNVNRELLDCQLWLVLALGNYGLPEGQARDLEQISGP